MLAGQRRRAAPTVMIVQPSAARHPARERFIPRGPDGPRTYIVPGIVQVSSTTQPGADTDADTVAVGVFEGEDARGYPGRAGRAAALGRARRSLKSLGLTHAQGKRWLIVGLGERGELTPERARVAAAAVQARALELATRALCCRRRPRRAARSPRRSSRARSSTDYRFDLTSPPRPSEAGGEPRRPSSWSA